MGSVPRRLWSPRTSSLSFCFLAVRLTTSSILCSCHEVLSFPEAKAQGQPVLHWNLQNCELNNPFSL